ncbi:nuclear transport factor 2 family protein [Nonomuraea sp. NPDC049784]|uniref:nuclear transport factor 2 family protein n=1 Tax=Nonomuraea sp. NPDC049784 TaxID=3154361 RepID=UPI00340004B8
MAERFYAAISRGDTATINELIAPEADLRVPGANPISGSYHGTSGLARFTRAAAALAPGGARTDVIDIMAGERHVAVYGVSRANRPGRPPLNNHTVHLITVEENRVTAITIFNADQCAVDDFWS